MGDRQSYEDSRKGYPVTFDNLSEEYERYREDMVTALAAKDEEIAKANECYSVAMNQWDLEQQRLRKAEAENERLKCCGNCGERGGDYGDECCRSWLGPVEPYHAYRPADNVAPADHCHFTPSRWQRREG